MRSDTSRGVTPGTLRPEREAESAAADTPFDSPADRHRPSWWAPEAVLLGMCGVARAVLALVVVPVVLSGCGDREPMPTDQLSWCGAVGELAGGDVDPGRLPVLQERLADPPAEIAPQWRQLQAGNSAVASPAYQRVAGYLADECGRDLADLRLGG
jgi:hypothetical protein